MGSARKVSKVVIPVAGLGTRFLPATKSLPKELLPIVNVPIIHFIVQEAVEAGLDTVVFVTSRPKVSIEDYFDPGDLSSLKLAKAGKDRMLDEVIELSKKIQIVSVRQYEPLGLGHAILQAAPIVRGESFAVILGDDILRNRGRGAIGQCIDRFTSSPKGSVVGILEVPQDQTSLYGIVEAGSDGKVKRFVEKPAPGTSPSNWAMPGRYVFESGILEALEKVPAGANGEIQLTDGMQRLLKESEFQAVRLQGERFDTGDKLGYIMANVHFALEDPQHGAKFEEWLRKRLS